MPPATKTPRVTTRPAKEAVLAGATDLARSAAEELALAGQVGEHRGVVVEAERLVTHVFESLVPGYKGWHWAVTVARPPRGRVATVCEVELLPGEGALLAPEWVPWSERVRPEDVGPTDVLPFIEDDERLEPGYEATGEDADELAIYELGLGRARVLSAEGRAQAMTRWYDGDRGPAAPIARAAAAPCSTCGFFMKLAGSPRTVFGVCANEWSPDDGRVVSMDHGCGAHSETQGPEQASLWQTSEPVIDERDLEVLETRQVAPNVLGGDDGGAEQGDAAAEPSAGPESMTAESEAGAAEEGTVASGAGEEAVSTDDSAETDGAPQPDVSGELSGEDESESAADAVPDRDSAAADAAVTETAGPDAAPADAAGVEAAATEPAESGDRTDGAETDAVEADAVATDGAETDAVEADAVATDAVETDAAEGGAAETGTGSDDGSPDRV